MKLCGHVINGEERHEGDNTSPVFNPATGKAEKEVYIANEAVVTSAVTSAHEALHAWSSKTPVYRARLMMSYLNLLREREDVLAECISREHGKTLKDAKGEVTRGLEIVEFACGAPHLLKGVYSSQVGTGIDSYTLHQPVGVCLGISPFNFPAMIPLWMFPIALVCGNTFVLKPSEKTPSAAILLSQWWLEAGGPEGVLNVCQGNRETAELLIKHPLVSAVSFVGSSAAAHGVYRLAGEFGKRCQALGGAKNHAIVMPDADQEYSINAVIGAAYGSAGERCMALPTAVLVGDRADEWVCRLAEQIENIHIGPYDAEGVEMGPLVTAEHRDHVISLIGRGQEEGADLVIDGRELMMSDHEEGFFLGPSLFDNVTPDMDIQKQEIFGPVLNIMRAPDYETALTWVSEHTLGNGSVIFTRDGGVAQHFAQYVQSGMVGINVPLPVPMAFHSFGGWKRSVFGDTAIHGPEGVRFYTRLKNVTQRWTGEYSQPEFVMPTMTTDS